MVTIDMTIGSFDDGSNKMGIGLLESLIEIRYIPHHHSKEGNGSMHLLLQFKVQIMFPGVVSLTCRLQGHVVHVSLAKEVLLFYQFCHCS